jgi:hypothetical protein
MLTEWDVSELRPPTGLLFIPGWYVSVASHGGNDAGWGKLLTRPPELSGCGMEEGGQATVRRGERKRYYGYGEREREERNLPFLGPSVSNYDDAGKLRVGGRGRKELTRAGFCPRRTAGSLLWRSASTSFEGADEGFPRGYTALHPRKLSSYFVIWIQYRSKPDPLCNILIQAVTNKQC